MTKKKAKSAPASHEVPGSGYTKPAPVPYPKRHRVQITFPADGVTRGSFKAECEIDEIVAKFVDTGMLTHVKRGSPEYGDAPDQTLFEAAVLQAEIRSKAEEGAFDEPPESQETPSDAPDDEKEPVTGSPPGTGKKALHAENEAAELTSSAE